MTKHRLVKWIILCLVIATCLSIVAFSTFYRVEHARWSVSTVIGQRHAEVSIVWTMRPGFMAGHQYILGGGDWKYSVDVKFADGKRLKFKVNREPKAIWEFNGLYHVACDDVGEGWLLLKLDDNGNLTRIYKKDLPKGELNWNLVPQDAQAECQRDFDLWAE